MRSFLAPILGLGLLTAVSVSVADAQGITRDNAWQYQTGSLKRHKAAVTHKARKDGVHGHKVKKAREP